MRNPGYGRRSLSDLLLSSSGLSRRWKTLNLFPIRIPSAALDKCSPQHKMKQHRTHSRTIILWFGRLVRRRSLCRLRVLLTLKRIHPATRASACMASNSTHSFPYVRSSSCRG